MSSTSLGHILAEEEKRAKEQDEELQAVVDEYKLETLIEVTGPE